MILNSFICSLNKQPPTHTHTHYENPFQFLRTQHNLFHFYPDIKIKIKQRDEDEVLASSGCQNTSDTFISIFKTESLKYFNVIPSMCHQWSYFFFFSYYVKFRDDIFTNPHLVRCCFIV